MKIKIGNKIIITPKTIEQNQKCFICGKIGGLNYRSFRTGGQTGITLRNKIIENKNRRVCQFCF